VQLESDVYCLLYQFYRMIVHQGTVIGGTGMSRLSGWAIYNQLYHILSTDRRDIPVPSVMHN